MSVYLQSNEGLIYKLHDDLSDKTVDLLPINPRQPFAAFAARRCKMGPGGFENLIYAVDNAGRLFRYHEGHPDWVEVYVFELADGEVPRGIAIDVAGNIWMMTSSGPLKYLPIGSEAKTSIEPFDTSSQIVHFAKHIFCAINGKFTIIDVSGMMTEQGGEPFIKFSVPSIKFGCFFSEYETRDITSHLPAGLEPLALNVFGGLNEVFDEGTALLAFSRSAGMSDGYSPRIVQVDLKEIATAFADVCRPSIPAKRWQVPTGFNQLWGITVIGHPWPPQAPGKPWPPVVEAPGPIALSGYGGGIAKILASTIPTAVLPATTHAKLIQWLP